MKKIKIICTLGPSSFKLKVLTKLKKEKIDIVRINLSHTPQKEIIKKINFLKKNKINNICIDTEGAQLRTTFINKGIFLKRNLLVNISNKNEPSNKKNIFMYPEFEMKKVKKNTMVHIGFDGLCLNVLKYDKKSNTLKCKVIEAGILGANKGVHFETSISLPALTEKDKFALELAKKMKIKYIAVSFVNFGTDLDEIKKIMGRDCIIISKIETNNALINLKEISKKSNALLIDRGDLSRYVPIEKIPIVQASILNYSKKNKIETYVATNLLETMIVENQPTRAESHDIFSTLNQGARGLVLAAESAIGKDPINCVKFLKRCIRVFNNKKKIEYNYG